MATPAAGPGAAAADVPVGTGDVVVTARNRAERLQDVPLAITALTGEQLATAGVRNLREISYLTPGVTINSAGGEAYTQPIIRGLVNLNGGASDPNVAVFLDGVYIVNNSAISVGLIDIDRVEIVKGPVGTLYGHNGFAGAINYVTRRPGNELRGQFSATIGNDGQRLVTGAASGPLIRDVLSIGLAGAYENYDGGYRDPVNGLRAGGYEKKDFRGSFNLTPATGVSLYGGLYYGKDFFDTISLVYAADNCGALSPGSAALGESTFTQYCGRLRFNPLEVSAVQPASGAAGNRREVYSANLHLDIDTGFATLSAIGGYNRVTQQRFEDFIGRRNNLIFNVTPAAPPPSTVSAAELFGGDSNNRDYSAEVRLTSKQDQRFRWAIGAYYYHNDFTTSTLIGIDASVLPAGKSFSGTAALFATPAGRFSTSNLTLVNGTDEQKSAFASADVDVVAGLTLNGEIRYTHQEKSQDILRNAFVANTVRPYGPARSGRDNFVNYRASIKYKFSDEVSTYASVASGTKAFGFNSRATAFPGEVSFNPEYATAYEVGAKTNLLNRVLTLNVAAYVINTRNLQVQVPSQDPTNTGLITANLGATREKGFEIEAVMSPAPWFHFNVGVGYVDARFRGGAADFGSAGSCAAIPSCSARIRTTKDVNGVTRSFVLLDGLQVPRVSPWQVSTGLTLSGHFSPDVSWFTRGDFRLEDSQFTAANNYNFQGDRTLVNLRAGIETHGISATVFVDNLTKNMTVESSSANTRLNDFVANPVGFLPTPRRYGLTVGYAF
ncbi:TonB-dependent receptor [Sphingomonas sp.]|uniref:TonB-dependent receptor n=1 Tax=Sphingomonas sp. TaxID=28214 RepID=UPI003CC58A59